MDRNGSTTPPLPPPEPTETEQPRQQQSPVIGSPQKQDRAQSLPVEVEAQRVRVDSNNSGIQPPRRPITKTPEPQMMNGHLNGHGTVAQQQTPSTPGSLISYDWEELESRFEQALTDANEHERELLSEFDGLVKYFNVWASAASAHDNERASKRLQTRSQYVKIQEQSLEGKKQHYDQVMKAFQGAMALLSKP